MGPRRDRASSSRISSDRHFGIPRYQYRFAWPLRLLLLSITLSLVYMYIVFFQHQPTLPNTYAEPSHNIITAESQAQKREPINRPTLASSIDVGTTNYTLGVTSALKSTYRLVDERLRVGDTVHIVIQAKDSQGRDKTFGGDFWFVVVTSLAGDYPNSGGRTAGSVVDYGNGTYSVFFYAAWEGIAHIHLTMVTPSEATKWIQEKYWPIEKRVFWMGTFLGMYMLDKGVCYLLRNETASSPDLCVINRNEKAMGLTVFYCERPRHNKCEEFRALSVSGSMVNSRTNEILNGDAKLFRGENVLKPLTEGPKTISISKSTQAPKAQLPICKPDSKRLLNDGFWMNEKWHHLQCKVHRWNDAQAIKDCLRHKHVFMHGDSNIRCWYGVLAKKMGYQWKHLGRGNLKLAMHNYYEDSGVESSFYFHPWVVTTASVSSSTTPYEVDIMDGIKPDACSKYIIVLCPWGHFTQWTRDSYIERTLLLKAAAVRLKERCPDLPIIIKGPHAREHENTLKIVYASDYTMWSWGRILRDTFRGTGVYYYENWQMNLAFGKPDMHMPIEVVDEEVNWFLSYVCTA